MNSNQDSIKQPFTHAATFMESCIASSFDCYRCFLPPTIATLCCVQPLSQNFSQNSKLATRELHRTSVVQNSFHPTQFSASSKFKMRSSPVVLCFDGCIPSKRKQKALPPPDVVAWSCFGWDGLYVIVAFDKTCFACFPRLLACCVVEEAHGRGRRRVI